MSVAFLISAQAQAEDKKLIGSYCDKSMGPAIGYFLYDFYQDAAGNYYLAEQKNKDGKAGPANADRLDVTDQNILRSDDYFETSYDFNSADGNVRRYFARDANPLKQILYKVDSSTRYKDCFGWD